MIESPAIISHAGGGVESSRRVTGYYAGAAGLDTQFGLIERDGEGAEVEAVELVAVVQIELLAFVGGKWIELAQIQARRQNEGHVRGCAERPLEQRVGGRPGGGRREVVDMFGPGHSPVRIQ